MTKIVMTMIMAMKGFEISINNVSIYMIYFLTAFGLSPGGSTHLHTNSTKNNTNNNRTTQHVMWKSAGRAPSLRVLP